MVGTLEVVWKNRGGIAESFLDDGRHHPFDGFELLACKVHVDLDCLSNASSGGRSESSHSETPCSKRGPESLTMARAEFSDD